jgi:uncharacterized protein (TIGR02271 family)
MTDVSDLDRGGVPMVSDEAMTRSEEQLRVGVQTRAVTRAVLRKYIVTEEVTRTFTVRREEVRLEQIPVTDDGAGDPAGSPLAPEEFEFVLHEERPVITTEVVPVERVRLRKEVVTDYVEVSDQLRKEQFDVDVDRPEVR